MMLHRPLPISFRVPQKHCGGVAHNHIGWRSNQILKTPKLSHYRHHQKGSDQLPVDVTIGAKSGRMLTSAPCMSCETHAQVLLQAFSRSQVVSSGAGEDRGRAAEDGAQSDGCNRARRLQSSCRAGATGVKQFVHLHMQHHEFPRPSAKIKLVACQRHYAAADADHRLGTKFEHAKYNVMAIMLTTTSVTISHYNPMADCSFILAAVWHRCR